MNGYESLYDPHTQVVAERNRLRADVGRLQSELAGARRELAEAKARIAVLERQDEVIEVTVDPDAFGYIFKPPPMMVDLDIIGHPDDDPGFNPICLELRCGRKAMPSGYCKRHRGR